MKIKSFIENVMTESLILNYDLKIIIERVNKFSNIFEIYIKKEEDVYLNIDFRFRDEIKDRYAIKEIEKAFLEDFAEALINFSKIRNQKQIAINNLEIKLSENKNELGDEKYKKASLVFKEIYEPEEMWISNFLINYDKKIESLTKRHYFYEISHLKEIMSCFMSEYMRMSCEKLIHALKTEYNCFIKTKSEQMLLEQQKEYINNKIFEYKEIKGETPLDEFIIKTIDMIVGRSKIEEERQKKFFLENKRKQLSQIDIKIEITKYEQRIEYKKICCLLKDLSSSLLIRRNKDDYIYNLKAALKKADLLIEKQNLSLMFDILLLIKEKQIRLNSVLSTKIKQDFFKDINNYFKDMSINEQEQFLVTLLRDIKAIEKDEIIKFIMKNSKK